MHAGSREARPRAAQLFQTLSADGAAAAADQRSLPRRLALVLMAALLAVAIPLGWAQSVAADGGGDTPQAVINKSGSDDDESGSDDDESGGDDDDDDTTAGDDGTDGDGTEGESGPDGTRGQTGNNADEDTNRETQAQNTDRPGLDTGVSTKGETDPGDKTGKTERR